ncbi:mechanosensitive ion channel family protein [Flagellatimonas centrodinii]|uniref:mechanosensitive ion channel family protein n=1 Tax=Flagellatimonas centrodinii TaxID=2806210 RepID=UPI001FEE0376|nr:mechanosensitive ion channel family protein [Flagellatimonas centrodinii]ULQ46232.1 mechanosensitive ion channel family protein [Flagellatimonas centrodinii]
MKSVFDAVPADFRLLSILATIIGLTALLNWALINVINRLESSRLTTGSVDKTAFNFAKRLISVLIYGAGFGACLTHIPELKIVGHSLLTGAGILTIVGGLASQQVLGNIVSGFMIVFFRPFRIGDRITLSGNYSGTVEDITLRETIVRDAENNRIIIPNSQISSEVVVNANHTDHKICKFIDVGVGYSSDLERAMTIMQEEIVKHPLVIDQRTEAQIRDNTPIVPVRVMALGDSSVTLRAWAWADNPANGFLLQCDSYVNVKRRFDEAGIEIPFPQQTISFANGKSDSDYFSSRGSMQRETDRSAPTPEPPR